CILSFEQRSVASYVTELKEQKARQDKQGYIGPQGLNIAPLYKLIFESYLLILSIVNIASK
ncbi:MAG: hypothetical protein K2M61_07610, partial [Muribaculaceae bacterium]|nr:hypothetical protein [Muribaculaceae bacterium]